MFNKNENKEINIDGTYIENNYGTIINNSSKSLLTNEEFVENIDLASIDLFNHDNKFQGKIHIDRNETTQLYNWIIKDFNDTESRVAILVGEAGYGKSVIFKDLLELLKANEIPALGVKVDKILNINSIGEIEKELNLKDNIISIFQELDKNNKILVLLIDQIDALSQSLSSNRNAINSYDRLIKILEKYKSVRIIISCRTYDLEYDPTLRSYKGKKIFRTSLLDFNQVEKVLNNFNIRINPKNLTLKQFLCIPLHLNLFCKEGINIQFDEEINQQKLYDAIWNEYVLKENPERKIEILALISNKMIQQQHIVVDKRNFDLYTKELNYLMRNDLVKVYADNKIQFMHQTFFDYIYARTFISAGNILSSWLKEVHQGLFIRSQVRQIIAYLRDYETELYISELKKIISGNYRFHLKLLLISSLGFYKKPLQQEKKLILEEIIHIPLFFQIFLESIQSPAWFKFIISQNIFKTYIKNGNEIDSIIIDICDKIILQDPKLVIDFLNDYDYKTTIIENVLHRVPLSEVPLSYDLYNKTSSKWNNSIRYDYYYLKLVLKVDPDFVITNLKKDFDKNLHEIDPYIQNYIPGGYSGLSIYSDLYRKYPDKAISYFLYIIEEIIKLKSFEELNGYYRDYVFYLYKPKPEILKNDFYDYKDIYGIIFYHIKNKLLNQHTTNLILNTLKSKYVNIVAIGVYYLLENRNLEINHIYNLLIQKNFFEIISLSEILSYYSKELLANTYHLLSNEQKENVNQSILNTKKKFSYHTYEEYYTNEKIHSYYLAMPYQLISMIPDIHRKNFNEIEKIYQEGFRKYGVQTNHEPRELVLGSGFEIYSQEAYNNMSLNDWKNTFLKLNAEDSSFFPCNKPCKEGNVRKFEEYVSKNPNKFYSFINDLIDEKEISVDYLIAGIGGLQKGTFFEDKIQELCLKLIKQRRSEFNDNNLLTYLRLLRPFIKDNKNIDDELFLFIKDIIYKTNDRKFTLGIANEKEQQVFTLGINSTRGAAVELLVFCYNTKRFDNQMFESLEYIADNANEITRSCAIFNASCLNNLDSKRALKLYLRLVKDFSPYLLALPCHSGHPLLYLVNVDFKKLISFFEKAITIKEAGKPMVIFLFNAYVNGRTKSFTLLKTLLCNNSRARQELLWFICTRVLSGKYSHKGWKIINFLLNFNDKELGEKLNSVLLNMPCSLDHNLIIFINKLLKSPLINYIGNNLYDLLRNLIPLDANQCLIWFFASNPEKIQHGYFYDKSPLNVLIEGYNGIREYDKYNPILEKTMDVFDSLLQVAHYRNSHMRTLLSNLES